eukprot:6202770-Pleurochrysis_carterae.AAC.3
MQNEKARVCEAVARLDVVVPAALEQKMKRRGRPGEATTENPHAADATRTPQGQQAQIRMSRVTHAVRASIAAGD